MTGLSLQPEIREEKKEEVIKPACPHCGSMRGGRRSRLRWFDLPLLLLFVRPARCRDCYCRYYRFTSS